MIRVEEPALALNDIRERGHFRLSQNILVRRDDNRQNLVSAVANIAFRSPGGRLKSLVLNSHGFPGFLVMGEGFWRDHGRSGSTPAPAW